MGSYLDRAAILGAADLVTEDVHVPEWGPDAMVRVRGLTGRQRHMFETSMLMQRGNQMVTDWSADVRAKLIALCVVDADGQPVFTAADAEALGEKSAVPIVRIGEVAARLSGLKEEDIEELAGNFGGPNGDGSSSASPATSAKRSPRSSAK